MKAAAVVFLCGLSASVLSGCQSEVDKCVGAGLRAWQEDYEKLSEYRREGKEFTISGPTLTSTGKQWEVRDHVEPKTLDIESPLVDTRGEYELKKGLEDFARTQRKHSYNLDESSAEAEVLLRLRCGAASAGGRRD